MATTEAKSSREAADGRARASSTRPRPGWVMLLTLLLAAAVGGSWYALQVAQRPSPVETGSPPPEVTVANPLRRELVEWDEFTGRFEAVEQVEVRARVAGYLDAAHFRDGQLDPGDDPRQKLTQALGVIRTYPAPRES